MNSKIIKKSVESFFLPSNLERIDKEYENLCEAYREYREYKANPYEDNEPLSHLESDPWSYVPVFTKPVVSPPSESKYEKVFSDLFLAVKIVDKIWVSLDEEQKRILSAKSNRVAAKYYEAFGQYPVFISNKFW